MPTENRHFTTRHEDDDSAADSIRIDDAWDLPVQEAFPGITFESWSRARCWATED